MKSVLISIKPEWCRKILGGFKTMEIRTTKPIFSDKTVMLPFKSYIYCSDGMTYFKSDLDGSYYLTKGKRHILGEDGEFYIPDIYTFGHHATVLNRKVIAEFTCPFILGNCQMANADFARQLGLLTDDEIRSYSCEFTKELFGWGIKDLKIYDQPKNISDFICNTSSFEYDSFGKISLSGMKKAPQSWCYVEEKHDVLL